MFVEQVADRLNLLAQVQPGHPLLLVIDDLDAFAASCPSATDTLWGLVEDCALDAGAGGTPPTRGLIVLLASATTVATAGAFRGPLAELRAARHGVVLQPGTPGSSEIFGVDLGWCVEPEIRRPGRGALVDGGSSTFVQVASPA